jgi:hypothetical protein
MQHFYDPSIGKFIDHDDQEENIDKFLEKDRIIN